MNFKKHQFMTLSLLLVFTTLILFFQNCGQNYGIDTVSDNTNIISVPAEREDDGVLPSTPKEEVYCDPLGGGQNSASPGLKAKLTTLKSRDFLSNSAKNYHQYVDNYFPQNDPSKEDYSQVISEAVYFSQLNITPRKWTEGFESPQGLMQYQGEALNEWFGLEFETNVKLATNEEEGYYQLATISDDGSKVGIKYAGQSEVYQTILENDGLHSPRLKCSQMAIQIRKGDRIPTNIRYFQGPRSHISLILLWKKVDSIIPQEDPDCNSGAVLGKFFKDPAQASNNSIGEKLDKYDEFLSRGWKVLSSENFETQESVQVICQ